MHHTIGLLRLRLTIVLLSVGVLALTLGFNVMLSVSTLDTQVIKSMLSGYRGAGEHLAYSIERGLRFGKPLGQYAGMSEMIRDLRDSLNGVEAVSILDDQGRTLYSLRDAGNEKDDPATLTSRQDLDRRILAQFSASSAASAPGAGVAARAGNATDAGSAADGVRELSEGYQVQPDSYRLIIPLRFAKAAGGVAGGVVLEIAKSTVDAATRGFVRWAMILLFVTCAVVSALLAAWIGLLTTTHEARARLHSSLGKLLFVLIGGTQIAYSGATLILFDSFMTQAVHTKTEIIAQSVKRDFEYLIHKGVDVTSLKGGDSLLANLVDSNAELQGASLVTPDGTVLAQAGRIGPEDSVVETSIASYWPSRFRQQQAIMRVRIALDPMAVSGSVRGLAIDLLTGLVISLLFLVELAKLLGLISNRILCTMFARTAEERAEVMQVSYTGPMLRAAGFLFFLGYDMGLSFIPILARKLYEPMWGLSEEVLTGLPISAEMVCAGVALLLAGVISERFGWRTAFVLGAISASAGLLFASQTATLPGLILARGIAGFGFGLILMTVQIGALGDANTGSGIAGVFAGIFSGSICGSAGGAMLAERVGFDAVFLVAALLIPVAVLVLPLAGRPGSECGDAHVETRAKTNFTGSWAFLGDARMYALLLCVGIPAAVCLTGFLHYLLPVLLSSEHVAQSDIGRIFMVYGLCFITVGPMLGRWIDRVRDKSFFALLTGLFSGGALLVASMFSSTTGVSVAVLVIGIAQCLAAPATMLCVISLRSAQQLGREKTASIFRSLERTGQVLGPILFGIVLVVLGTAQTLLVVGGVVCLLAVIFWLFWRFSTPKG